MGVRGARGTTVLLVAGALAIGVVGTAFGDQVVRLAANSVGTAQIKNGAVTGAKIKRGSLTRAVFKPGQVPRANLAGIKARGALTGTYPAPDLAENAVRGANLASASVGARAIASNAVGRTEIAAGAVGPEELASGAVRTGDIADGAVARTKIANGAVGAPQIGANAVGRSEIASGAVGAGELAPLPGASAYRAADYAVAPNVLVVVPLTDVAFDQGGVVPAGQRDRLVAPRRGVYLATASAGFRNTGLGTRGLWIAPPDRPDRPYVGETAPVTADSAGTLLSVSTVLLLDQGDAVSLVVRQTGQDAVNLQGGAGQTTLALQFLSPG